MVTTLSSLDDLIRQVESASGVGSDARAQIFFDIGVALDKLSMQTRLDWMNELASRWGLISFLFGGHLVSKASDVDLNRLTLARRFFDDQKGRGLVATAGILLQESMTRTLSGQTLSPPVIVETPEFLLRTPEEEAALLKAKQEVRAKLEVARQTNVLEAATSIVEEGNVLVAGGLSPEEKIFAITGALPEEMPLPDISLPREPEAVVDEVVAQQTGTKGTVALTEQQFARAVQSEHMTFSTEKVQEAKTTNESQAVQKTVEGGIGLGLLLALAYLASGSE